MRFTLIFASAAAFLLAANSPLAATTHGAPVMVPAVAAIAVAAQDAQATQPPRGGDVDITIGTDGGTVWYANPVWIAIGLLAVVIVALLIGMVARGGGGGGDTIVK